MPARYLNIQDEYSRIFHETFYPGVHALVFSIVSRQSFSKFSRLMTPLLNTLWMPCDAPLRKAGGSMKDGLINDKVSMQDAQRLADSWCPHRVLEQNGETWLMSLHSHLRIEKMMASGGIRRERLRNTFIASKWLYSNIRFYGTASFRYRSHRSSISTFKYIYCL
jgi:hypothetical protein